MRRKGQRVRGKKNRERDTVRQSICNTSHKFSFDRKEREVHVGRGASQQLMKGKWCRNRELRKRGSRKDIQGQRRNTEMTVVISGR